MQLFFSFCLLNTLSNWGFSKCFFIRYLVRYRRVFPTKVDLYRPSNPSVSKDLESDLWVEEGQKKTRKSNFGKKKTAPIDH